MMQLCDQLSRQCIVTLVPSLMVLSNVAVVLSYIHIDSLLGSGLCSSVPLSTLNSLQPMWPWAPNCLAWKIFGMEFLWVQYVYNISYVFLYQEHKRGFTLLPVSKLLGRKGPLTRRLFTVFLWACHDLEKVLWCGVFLESVCLHLLVLGWLKGLCV